MEVKGMCGTAAQTMTAREELMYFVGNLTPAQVNKLVANLELLERCLCDPLTEATIEELRECTNEAMLDLIWRILRKNRQKKEQATT